MSIRSSQVVSSRQPGSSFVCSPLGSTVPGQCHCSPACSPGNNNNPLMYFRYSDCNVNCGCAEDEAEDEQHCNCRPDREQCPPCSRGTRCQPVEKCPIHVQMSCCGTPTAAEWKRFHKLKRQWAREKKRKRVHRSVCSTTCQLPDQHNVLQQNHGTQSADEVCAQALGIPTCVGNTRPILDPDSWRISRVMTSAGTSCPKCCPKCHNATVPVNLDVNFGVQYCGPSTQVPAAPYPMYNDNLSSYTALVSHKTQFNTPYRPSEDLKSRSLIRRPTPFPVDEVIPNSQFGLKNSNALLDYRSAVGSFRGSNFTGHNSGDMQSRIGSYVGGGIGSYAGGGIGSYAGGGSRQLEEQSQRPTSGSAYEHIGHSVHEPSMLGSRMVRSERLGSAVPTYYSQVHSTFPNVQHSYLESEPDVIHSGENFEPYDDGNDNRSRREGSFYSRAVPTDVASRRELEHDRSVFSTNSKRSHKSHKSRVDGLSMNVDDGASTYTTHTAKSHRSRIPSQSVIESHHDENDDDDMDGERSTHTTHTNVKSHHSQRTLKKSPTNKSRIDTKSHYSQRSYLPEPSVYTQIDVKKSPTNKSRIDTKSHYSQKSYQPEPSVYTQLGVKKSPTNKSRIDTKSHYSQNSYQPEPSVYTQIGVKKSPTNKSRIDTKSHYSQKSYQPEPSVYTQIDVKKSPTNKSRIDTKSHYSQNSYQPEPSVYTQIGAKSQRSQFFNNEFKKKTPLGKSTVNFHHTVKTEDGKSRMNFGENEKSRMNFGNNKSRMGQMGKSTMSVATKRGNSTDSESDDSSDDSNNPSSIVTALQLSETLKSRSTPMSVANKSHKSRKTLRMSEH